MPFAITLLFDTEAEQRIKAIWKKFASDDLDNHTGISNIRPHISLAIFNELDIADAKRKLKRFARSRKPFSMALASIGTFPANPGILFLAPAPNKTLLDFHRKIYRIFQANRYAAWDLYQGKHWVPHCTLAMDLPQNSFIKALRIALHTDYPIQLHAEEIGLAEFFPVKPLGSFKLAHN